MKRSVGATWAFVLIACIGGAFGCGADEEPYYTSEEEYESVEEEPVPDPLDERRDREKTYLSSIRQTFDRWGSELAEEQNDDLIAVGWKACQMIVTDGLTEQEAADDPGLINEVKAIRDANQQTFDISPSPEGADKSNAREVAETAHFRLCRDDFNPQLL
ncbi:hypothetical protein [Streptomyces sp. YIM B13502]|uniref:hypothetical protein n=1 Tax=Streptomyces sp. YIM B13502 TaxID=3366317 RepID=UPI0036C15A6A